jgi:hypothetical protein
MAEVGSLTWGPRSIDGIIGKLVMTENRSKKGPKQYPLLIDNQTSADETWMFDVDAMVRQGEV